MHRKNLVVVVKCNGKILREDTDGNVYLPFGSEYSILLSNKDSRNALVEIEVDGENVLNSSKLILSGGKTEEIKGFMRDMHETNRFKFIEKTKEISKFRGDKLDDGLVRVSFQFESYSKPYVYPDWSTIRFASNMYGTGDTNLKSIGTPDTYMCSFSSDAGITVKGSKINQNFTYGSIGSLDPEIYVICLNLKGSNKLNPVQKPITVKTKTQCSTCGRSNKFTNKFCFNCGTYLK